MVRTVQLSEVYQARVSPEQKWPHKKIIVHFDSQLVFPTLALAEKFVPYYVRELIETGVLSINDKYEAGVIKLNVFNGTVDINGVEAAS